MFGGWGPGWRIGRFFGIEVVIDASLVVLGGLITWMMYTTLAQSAADTPSVILWLAAGSGGVLFLVSILIHELSHSLVAVRRGLDVRRIRLFLFGGVSEIESEALNARDEFAVAVVGPISSLALAGVFFAAFVAVPDRLEPIRQVLLYLTLVNTMLGVFNLAPGFPLDGGRVLRAIVWSVTKSRKRATTAAVRAGKVVALLLVAAGFYQLIRLGELTGLWSVAIGWFLFQAAATNQVRERAVEIVEGMSADTLMVPATAAVDGDLSLRRFNDLYLMGPRFRPYPVVVAGRVRGLIGPVELASVAEDQWDTTSIRGVMASVSADDVVDAATPIVDLFGRLSDIHGRLLVVARGRLVGVLYAVDLHRLVAKSL